MSVFGNNNIVVPFNTGILLSIDGTIIANSVSIIESNVSCDNGLIVKKIEMDAYLESSYNLYKLDINPCNLILGKEKFLCYISVVNILSEQSAIGFPDPFPLDYGKHVRLTAIIAEDVHAPHLQWQDVKETIKIEIEPVSRFDLLDI